MGGVGGVVTRVLAQFVKYIRDILVVSLILLLGIVFTANMNSMTLRLAATIGIVYGIWFLHWLLLMGDVNAVEAGFSMLWLMPISKLVMGIYSTSEQPIWPLSLDIYRVFDIQGVDTHTVGLVGLAWLCVCLANAVGLLCVRQIRTLLTSGAFERH